MIIVDTCIWSQVFRKNSQANSIVMKTLKEIIEAQQVLMVGPIRQEILSGVKDELQFQRLKRALSSFPDHPIITSDYEQTARFFNLCRSYGIQGSNTDYLLCALSIRYEAQILTTDKDFSFFQKHLPIHCMILSAK